MRITIDSMSQHIQTLDSGISHVKSILSTSCPSILRKDIIQFIRVLNARLWSFLEECKASKFNSLLSNRPISLTTNHISLANSTNLVVTIPPDLTLSDSERSVLAKGLKFVPSPGSLTFFQLRPTPNHFSDACVRKDISIIILRPSQGRFWGYQPQKIILVSPRRPIWVPWTIHSIMSTWYRTTPQI
jgi:hypothetical protein